MVSPSTLTLPEYAPPEDKGFWTYWSDRFLSGHHTYITPRDPAVIDATTDATTNTSSAYNTGLSVWDWVAQHTTYTLSKDWKQPAQTITEGKADCEDVTFLIASMMLAAGYQDTDIAIGYLVYPDGTAELHTWNTIAQEPVDGTGTPGNIDQYTYDTVATFTLSNTDDKGTTAQSDATAD